MTPFDMSEALHSSTKLRMTMKGLRMTMVGLRMTMKGLRMTMKGLRMREWE